MTRLPDISEWYDAEDHALTAQVGWLLNREWRKQLSFVHPRLRDHNCQSVLEVGCGSGLLAAELRILMPEMIYLGIDASERLLNMARTRARALKQEEIHFFEKWDVRSWGESTRRDCVMAFGVFKHFALDEWRDIACRVLWSGMHACFDVQMLDKDLDNGTEFHHTFVCEDSVRKMLMNAKHEIIDRAVWHEGTLDGQGKLTSEVFWTRRTVP